MVAVISVIIADKLNSVQLKMQQNAKRALIVEITDVFAKKNSSFLKGLQTHDIVQDISAITTTTTFFILLNID